MSAHHKPEGPADPRWRTGYVLASIGSGWIQWCGPMKWRVRRDLTLPYSYIPDEGEHNRKEQSS